jgi:glycoside/pentoside/hexuronide:cation symporter, GPH family
LHIAERVDNKLSARNELEGHPLGLKLGYGVGIAAPMLGWVAAAQYLLFFYTELVGLSAAQAGLIFAIGMVWDALTDPVIGALADRTRSRWGRYRAYLLWAAIPYALAVPLAFTPPPAAIDAFAFTLATHVIFRTVYTLVYMPYTAMLAGITRDYDERTSLTSWKTAFVFATNLFVSVAFITLVLRFGGERSPAAFQTAAAVLGALAALAAWTCFTATRGRDAAQGPPPPRSDFAPRRILADLVRNRAFLVLFVGVIVYGGLYGVQISMLGYIAKYWLGDATLARSLFAAQAVAALATIPLWNWLGRRHGKRVVWAAGAVVAAFGALAIYFLRPTDALHFMAWCAISNAGSTAFIVVMFAMTADVVDFSGWQSGRRHEGVIFGAIACANKLANGVMTGLAASALAAFGFVANTAMSAETLDGLFRVAMLVPAIGFLASAALIRAYPITKSLHAAAVGTPVSSRAAER